MWKKLKEWLYHKTLSYRGKEILICIAIILLTFLFLREETINYNTQYQESKPCNNSKIIQPLTKKEQIINNYNQTNNYQNKSDQLISIKPIHMFSPTYERVGFDKKLTLF